MLSFSYFGYKKVINNFICVCRHFLVASKDSSRNARGRVDTATFIFEQVCFESKGCLVWFLSRFIQEIPVLLNTVRSWSTLFDNVPLWDTRQKWIKVTRNDITANRTNRNCSRTPFHPHPTPLSPTYPWNGQQQNCWGFHLAV